MAHPFPGVLNANAGLLQLIQSLVEQVENIANFLCGPGKTHDLLN